MKLAKKLPYMRSVVNLDLKRTLCETFVLTAKIGENHGRMVLINAAYFFFENLLPMILNGLTLGIWDV